MFVFENFFLGIFRPAWKCIKSDKTDIKGYIFEDIILF